MKMCVVTKIKIEGLKSYHIGNLKSYPIYKPHFFFSFFFFEEWDSKHFRLEISSIILLSMRKLTSWDEAMWAVCATFDFLVTSESFQSSKLDKNLDLNSDKIITFF